MFEVLDRLNHLLSNPDLTRPIEVTLRSILSNAPEKTHRSIVFQFDMRFERDTEGSVLYFKITNDGHS